jgi:undecaprenyl-diphosphatase
VNELDRRLAILLNQCAQRTRSLDHVLGFIGEEQALKGGVLILFFCWFWFTERGDRARNRPLVVEAVLGASAGSLISRWLTHVLPYRPRPLWDPTLGLIPPPTKLPEFLEKWSSLPSDHASLFIGLSFGLYRISRRAGTFALSYSCVVAIFPRLYLGLHYLSDVLAGALIGVLSVMIVGQPRVRAYVVKPVLSWHERSPGAFYVTAFFVGDQIVHLFGDVRLFLAGGAQVLRYLVHLVR